MKQGVDSVIAYEQFKTRFIPSQKGTYAPSYESRALDVLKGFVFQNEMVSAMMRNVVVAAIGDVDRANESTNYGYAEAIMRGLYAVIGENVKQSS